MNNAPRLRVLSLFPLLLFGLAAAGCRESGERVIEAQMASQFITERNSEACFTHLDRGAIPSLVRSFPPPAGMVLAGFASNWIPGEEPFPCNRYKRAEVRGMFKFSDRGPHDPPARLAVLELVEFQPAAGRIRVGDRTACNFKILSKRYPNAVDDRFHHGLDISAGAGELASRPRPIVVPDDAGRWTAVVTDEVLQTARRPADTDAPTVFLVVPSDPDFDSDQPNSCVGHFRFRLRLLTDG